LKKRREIKWKKRRDPLVELELFPERLKILPRVPELDAAHVEHKGNQLRPLDVPQERVPETAVGMCAVDDAWVRSG